MVQKSVPSKVSRNSGNYWVSEMPTIQPKAIPEIPGAKLNGKNTIENLGIPREVVLCFGNFGRCCSIRYRKLPKIQRGRFGWMESAQCLWLANYLKGERKKLLYLVVKEKLGNSSLRGRRLEVLGARKKRRASPSPLACLPRARPFSLAPTTSKPPAKQATQIREILLVNETWQARCLVHNKL